jgi:hypothetical protein
MVFAFLSSRLSVLAPRVDPLNKPNFADELRAVDIDHQIPQQGVASLFLICCGC